MKNENPPFDRKLLRVRRERGSRMGEDRFLYKRVADDAVERVLDINREFERSLLIGDAEISETLVNTVGHKLGHIVRVDYTNGVPDLDIVADEERLPFIENSFDFIFSGLGLHAVNAVPQTLMSIKRLLKPDGLFIAALFGGTTLSELRHALYEAEDMTRGEVSPRVSPMIDVQQAAGLLQKSGFTMPVVDRDKVSVNYRSLDDLYADLRSMGETSILAARSRKGASKSLFDALKQIYQRDHKQNDGRLKASFDILWMTGWSPHESQPKPLKPGSAKARLSDALGVKEQKL